MGCAVVDVEMIGLSPVRDRVVEIGVILSDESGKSEGKWRSLVNPLHGTGAVFVHGLTDTDVAGAPTPTDLLPQIRGLFFDRALVAHNAAFDVGFLNAPFTRADYGIHVSHKTTVCTMELSKIYLPPGRHGLAAAAERTGVATAGRHRALADVRTAAGLLRHYLNTETDGVRYAERAFSRSGEAIEPAAWIEARGVAAGLGWPDSLF